MNLAWVFLFGLTPTRLHAEPMFFDTREEAVTAARVLGLSVDSQGMVS
jgi:hypothetical protein